MSQAAAAHPFQMAGHIQRGDMAPWWNHGIQRFLFDPLTGRYIVLAFQGVRGDPPEAARRQALRRFDRFAAAERAYFLGISCDPRIQAGGEAAQEAAPLRGVFDAGAAMHRAYGLGAARAWIVLDPMLRVIEMIPFRDDAADIGQLADLLDALPPPARFLGIELAPPVLMLPDVFEPALCAHLIALYERSGGRESGFMQEVSGKAVEHYDPQWKRRKDCMVTDAALIEQIKARFARRVGLMLQRAFQFRLTRMERYLLACYAAEDGGHFGPHRDDTVKATEHRRFAVSINLNADFDGGDLDFPEFGPQRFKPPVGAALIFSAALLHRVNRVTRGRRYAFLAFLHDEEAEKLRLANLRFLAPPA